ncbi:MAG TPA: hypothetical protein VNP73_03495 [Actinomycetota bacterium]|nr:hypothetical protein [Actinomycetota bacterium]
MSSPSSDPPQTNWPLWRKLMLAGGFVLFGNALAEALMEPDPPRIVGTAALVIGFVLLASGFGQRFKKKN